VRSTVQTDEFEDDLFAGLRPAGSRSAVVDPSTFKPVPATEQEQS
jgi:hypothetical protein